MNPQQTTPEPSRPSLMTFGVLMALSAGGLARMIIKDLEAESRAGRIDPGQEQAGGIRHLAAGQSHHPVRGRISACRP